MRMQKVSKQLELLSNFYPIIHFILIFTAMLCFIKSPGFFSFLYLVFIVYFLSIIIWKILLMNYKFPEGAARIGKRAEGGNLWLIYYNLQAVYNGSSLPETILKAIPFAYSAWLRLWGSKVGKFVNWTPGCQVVDRAHLIIGDRCLVGNLSYLSAHIMKKNENFYTLYVKNIEIGSDCVMSFRATIGPGAKIKDNSFLTAGQAVYPNQVYQGSGDE